MTAVFAAHAREIALFEVRIAALDRELAHKANVIAAQADQLAVLRVALAPLAELRWAVDNLRHEDDSTCPHRLRAGDIRRAFRVLHYPGETMGEDESMTATQPPRHLCPHCGALATDPRVLSSSVDGMVCHRDEAGDVCGHTVLRRDA